MPLRRGNRCNPAVMSDPPTILLLLCTKPDCSARADYEVICLGGAGTDMCSQHAGRRGTRLRCERCWLPGRYIVIDGGATGSVPTRRSPGQAVFCLKHAEWKRQQILADRQAAQREQELVRRRRVAEQQARGD
jgi:hypothetical protein